MKVTNTAQDRNILINKYGIEYFESEWDLFFFHHLNTTVIHWHGVPVSLGFIAWGFAIYQLNIWYYLIGLSLMYIPQLLSHWIFDRYIARESVEKPLMTIYHAYKLYFLWLTFRVGKYEEKFLHKYEFAASAYTQKK